MDLLIATKNSYKVDEMKALLDGLENIELHFLRNQKFNVEVEEDGNTLTENAEKKAKEISKFTKYFTLASDGGVDIPTLGDDWNFLKNQRTIGEQKTDAKKAKTLLKMMKGLKGEERKVKFHLALAIAREGKILWSSEEVTEEGYIAYSLPDEDIPECKWLSHIWYYPQFKKVFNKLNEDELKEVRKQSEKLKGELHKFFLDNDF